MVRYSAPTNLVPGRVPVGEEGTRTDSLHPILARSWFISGYEAGPRGTRLYIYTVW